MWLTLGQVDIIQVYSGMHLARLLFLHLADREITIHQDRQGIYQLRLPSDTGTLFRLTLPRLHTWELLDKLPGANNSTPAAEQAEQFATVSFSPHGDALVVEHCCRLRNGKKYSLKELTGHRYGTRYLVDNRLFSLQSIPEQERLSNREKGQLSLFSLATPNSTDMSHGFTVPGPAIEKFIADNHYQLHCKRHRVAPEILKMKIVAMPSGLVLDHYRCPGGDPLRSLVESGQRRTGHGPGAPPGPASSGPGLQAGHHRDPGGKNPLPDREKTKTGSRPGC